jgi:hypothetical protein
MKKYIQLFLVVTVFAMVISCKNSREKKQELKRTQQTEEQHLNADADELKLNNGKLWKANIETTKGINNMLQLMDNFSEKDNPKAYTKLKQNLETEFNTIITKCTMTGKAHSQLHIYLVPMKDLFSGLVVVSIKTNKEDFDKLHAYLKDYKNYFK